MKYQMQSLNAVSMIFNFDNIYQIELYYEEKVIIKKSLFKLCNVSINVAFHNIIKDCYKGHEFKEKMVTSEEKKETPRKSL